MDINLTIKGDSFSMLGNKTLCFSNNPRRFIVFTDTGGVLGDQTSKVLTYSDFCAKSVTFVTNDMKGFRVKLNFDEDKWLHFDSKSHRDTRVFLERIAEWASPANVPVICFSSKIEKPVLECMREEYNTTSKDDSSIFSIGEDVIFKNDCVPILITVQHGRVEVQVMDYKQSELPVSKLLITLAGTILTCRNVLMIGGCWKLNGFSMDFPSETIAEKYLRVLGLWQVISSGEATSASIGLIGQIHVEGLISGQIIEKTAYDALIEESILTILKKDTGEPIASFSLTSPTLAIDGTAQEFLISTDHHTKIKITSESEEFLLAIFNNRPTRRRAYLSANTGPFVATTKNGEFVRIDDDQGRLLISSNSSNPVDMIADTTTQQISIIDAKPILSIGQHDLMAELPTLEGIAAKVSATHARLLLEADFQNGIANLLTLERKYLTYSIFGKLAEIQLVVAKLAGSDAIENVSQLTSVQDKSTFLSIMLQFAEARTQEIETVLYNLPAFVVERDKDLLTSAGLDQRYDPLEAKLTYQKATKACRPLIANLLKIQGIVSQYDTYSDASTAGAGWQTYAAKGASLATGALYGGPVGFFATAIAEGSAFINEQNSKSENAGNLLHSSFMACAQEWDFIIQVIVPALSDGFTQTTTSLRRSVATILLESYENDGEERKSKLLKLLAERIGRLSVFMDFPSTNDPQISRYSCVDLLFKIQESTEVFQPRYF
jgi:hypothetical protein